MKQYTQDLCQHDPGLSDVQMMCPHLIPAKSSLVSHMQRLSQKEWASHPPGFCLSHLLCLCYQWGVCHSLTSSRWIHTHSLGYLGSTGIVVWPGLTDKSKLLVKRLTQSSVNGPTLFYGYSN